MRIFVLTTGRTGSVTFARACSHIKNYTSGHETRIGEIERRLGYPDAHIEVDNRLAWFLGDLHALDPSAFYVHLTRDPADVARSYTKRLSDTWSRRGRLHEALQRARGTYRASIPDAFAHGVVFRTAKLDCSEADRAVRLMVDTINANILHFLRDKPHLEFDLMDPARCWPAFWRAIEAEGSEERGLVEFRSAHNASK